MHVVRELARDLERRRAALGVTKRRLAALAGVDETVLGRILGGRSRNFRVKTLEKIEFAVVAAERRTLERLQHQHLGHGDDDVIGDHAS